MKNIYAVYDCDDWKSYSSMDASSPLVITTSIRKMWRAVRKVLEGDELKNARRIINSGISPDSKIWELNDTCKNYYFANFED